MQCILSSVHGRTFEIYAEEKSNKCKRCDHAQIQAGNFMIHILRKHTDKDDTFSHETHLNRNSEEKSLK